MNEWTASAGFARDVLAALRHLYDPVVLRRSALLGLFDVEQTADPLASLRRILIESIEQLKPAPSTPSHAEVWRVYRILYERYVEQFEQDEVASHLSLGTRQLRRHEGRAVRVLADHLCRRHGLQDRLAHLDQPAATQSHGGMAQTGATPGREQELEWLRSAYPIESVSAGDLMQPVLKIVSPLAQTLGSRIVCMIAENLPRPAVQVTTMHQALSNVIAAALHVVPGGYVEVAADGDGGQVTIYVRSSQTHRLRSGLTADHLDNLDMARRLVGFSGGLLDVRTAGSNEQPFWARFVLPAATEIRVLVIEDNADTLELMRRHMQGTRYCFTGTTDPQEALGLAAEASPDIIVLDIMLPVVDGWELLGRLREHPLTHGAPILACSIVAQEQLALSLGAAAFLRKPISRAALLTVLDQIGERRVKASG